MQPYIFPYIGYFQLINAVDQFVVYDDVNYINKGWINRNNILINGKSNLFIIPLSEVSQNKHINKISLSGDLKWRNKLLKTIELAYKKAPFFNEAFPVIKEILLFEDKGLSGFSIFSLQKISDYLIIDTVFRISSEIDKNNELKGQHKIIEICKKLNATNYINAIGGQELYAKVNFESNKIALNFLKTQEIKYMQFGNLFTPWLSIIDVMMFNSPEQIKDFLNQYELV